MQSTDDRKKGGPAADDYLTQGDGTGLLSGPSRDSERFLSELKTFVADADVLLQQAKSLSGTAALAAREEFDRRLSQAKSLSGTAALAAREEFDRRLSQARTQYQAMRTKAVDHTHDYLDRTETYVRNEPWKAIGIAALAGAIVGVLLSRR